MKRSIWLKTDKAAKSCKGDLFKLRDLINHRTRTGTTPPQIIEIDRPAMVVQNEKLWLEFAATSSSAADAIKAALALAGVSLGEITGNEKESIDVGSKPTYSQSIGEQNEWGKTTCDDIAKELLETDERIMA